MRHLYLIVIAAFSLASCKVSDSVTSDFRKNSDNHWVYDVVSNYERLADKKNFKVIAQTDASKDILQLNRLFEKKLIENGFLPETENPDLLVQSAISSVFFESEELGFSSSVGLTDNSAYSPI
ncbi:hypothetical protein [Algoriphagus formosus]|uniref:hypothetical protein n=1 Tax=Algoriphagus formosus TaxID=2007308 RepID=UPI003F71EFA9